MYAFKEVCAKLLKRFALFLSANRLEEIDFLCLSLFPLGKWVIIHSSLQNIQHNKPPSFEGSTRPRHFVTKDPCDAYGPMLLPNLCCQSHSLLCMVYDTVISRFLVSNAICIMHLIMGHVTNLHHSSMYVHYLGDNIRGVTARCPMAAEWVF